MREILSELWNLFEKYTPIHPDYLAFNHVIFDAMELVEDCIIHVKLDHQPSQLLQFLQTQLTFESLEAVQRVVGFI